MAWMQSRFGRALEIARPIASEVQFYEIAHTLARINRYNGCAEPNVSVAFHTLIVADLVDEPLKPYALLHDAHEARTGDITTPDQEAMIEIADDLFSFGGYCVRQTIKEFKRRHDTAIYEAARVPEPTPDQVKAIKVADLRALATERRDFLRPAPQPWHPSIELMKPADRIYRAGDFGHTEAAVAERLYAAMVKYLPVLASAPEVFELQAA